MKTIVYKVHGKQLTDSRLFGPEPVPVEVYKEIPYSEDALERAQTEALPGTLKILEESDGFPKAFQVHKNIVLEDRSTGKLFELYVDNGKLMMEVF